MNIAYLGWGSLIWNPNGLPIRGVWHDDGPMLPIEFARQSSGKRITLVIVNDAPSVRSLWCLADAASFEDARTRLAEREGIKAENVQKLIGSYRREDKESHGTGATKIAEWAEEKKLDGVLWTNLEYGLDGSRNTMPTYDAVLGHLKSLPAERRKVAEEYIRRAPRQIDTNFRRGFERDLGWTFLE